jgi:hypothetical protein
MDIRDKLGPQEQQDILGLLVSQVRQVLQDLQVRQDTQVKLGLQDSLDQKVIKATLDTLGKPGLLDLPVRLVPPVRLGLLVKQVRQDTLDKLGLLGKPEKLDTLGKPGLLDTLDLQVLRDSPDPKETLVLEAHSHLEQITGIICIGTLLHGLLVLQKYLLVV